MDEPFDRIDPERAWAAIVGGLALVLGLGALLFPHRVYDRFLWRYFWGPVAADGNGAECAVRSEGSTTFYGATTACEQASGIVAEPGYTVVSTVSYAFVLVLLLIGVYFLVDRLEIEAEVTALYPLLPWVLFGGALRTVEDASVQLLEVTGEPAIPFPYTAAIISPFIYVTVFALAVAALVGSVRAADRGLVDRWETPFGAAGIALFVLALGALGYLSATTAAVGFTPSFLAIVLAGSLAITAVVWWATDHYWPTVNAGTGTAGILLVWGHTVDGLANVLSLDWNHLWGLPGYSPKHVVNAGIRDLMAGIQPGWLSDAVGVTWPFLLLKVAAAVFVVWLFNDEMFEESPRYSVLMLLAVLAVGLGPGTRDALRATFGI